MVNEPLSGHKSIKQAIRYHRRIKLSLTRMAIHRISILLMQDTGGVRLTCLRQAFRLKCLYGMLKAQMVLAHPKDLVYWLETNTSPTCPDKANANANTRLGHFNWLHQLCLHNNLL